MVTAGQLRPLSASTDLVTIQVGGNDSGISPAVTTCMGPFNRPACLAATGSVEVFGRTVLPARLDGVYDRVGRKAPDVRILVDYVDPLADERTHVGLACRMFRTPAGIAGSPTVEQLREAISGPGADV